MPLIPIVADMEDTGIDFDFELNAAHSKKYNALLKQKEQAVQKVISMYSREIQDYKRKNPNHGLSDPILITSSTQIAVLLYDIMGEKAVVTKSSKAKNESGRGTGEEIIIKMDNPLVKPLLEYREVAKLLSTYIDKMPGVVNPKTRRVHARFNQNGTDTGRFSSSDPNMQNIPSHNDDIRKEFKATDEYVMMSSDYSAQEPRITSTMSGDEKMIQAYKEGKDLYAAVASIAFSQPYEECLEFRPDGTKNIAGKERRGQAKAIVLGVCYGKGIPAIADDLRITKQKAQEIYDKIMSSFPKLRQFIDNSIAMAHELGYVTTYWGRKRRLPDVQLPEFEFSWAENSSTHTNFDPLADDEDQVDDDVPQETIDRFT
jgi:DNA polymerase I-like protein with 3'-5' exonuclease and polymerase domains